ncbi:MAG: hypothetical protein R3E66_11015 [bacterium]
MSNRLKACVSVLVACTTVLSACHKEYNYDRQDTPTLTLGHELFVIWKKDAERAQENAAEKAQMLDQNYPQFVAAVNTIAPESELTAVDEFLQNLLKLVDEGVLPALTRKIRVVLQEAAQDMALLAALVEPTGPDADTYVDPFQQPNLLGYVTAYPRLPELLKLIADVGLENDGYTAAGVRTFDEPSSVTDLTRVLVQQLREATPTDDEPLAVTFRDLAMVQDDDYVSDEDIAPLWVVLYDDRGYPLASMDGDTVAYPFVDADGDGLADINAAGEFVFQNGTSGELPPFSLMESADEPVVRDDIGRATLPNNQFAFQYVNLHATGLGFLVREFRGLSNKDTMSDMLSAFKAMLGPKTVFSDANGGYEGYSTDQPLMELSYATAHMLDTPAMPEVMEDMAALTERHPEALAGLVYALDQTVDILSAHPEAEMSDNQTMMYDLLPLLQELTADPALFADVMDALRSPITRRTGDSLATLLRYKDNDTIPAPGGPYDACFMGCRDRHNIGTVQRFECIRACPNGEIFSEPMDFSAPETAQGASLFQKFLHLIRDANGTRYSMDIVEASFDGSPLPSLPPLLVLPGAGEAFLASIAGNLDLANFVPDSLWQSDLGEILDFLGVDSGNVAALLSTLSPLFGAQLDRVPSPDQITRLFNQQDMRWETDRVVLDIADPVCKDGYVMSHHLAYGLYVGEAAGVIDTIYPIAKAFSDHGREDLLGNILGVLHDHYAGNPEVYKTKSGSPSEMKAANMRSYEAALEQVFSNGELFAALNDFAIALEDTENATGRPVKDNLRQFLVHALKQDGFRNFKGDDYIVMEDTRTLSNPSRMAFMLAALGDAQIRLDGVPESRQRLRSSLGNVIDVAVGAEKDTNGRPQFVRPGSPALAVHLFRYASARAKAKIADGTFSTWINNDIVPTLADLWTSRGLAAFVDLADNTLKDDADKALIDDFINYLLSSREGRSNAILGVHQLMVKSVNDDVWLPVGQFLASAIDPDRAWTTEPYADVPVVTLGAMLLAGTLEYDPRTPVFLIRKGLNVGLSMEAVAVWRVDRDHRGLF